MARTKKPAEAPSNEQLTAVIDRLRVQVADLAEKNQALSARNDELQTRKTKPARKFETEKIRVNGFVITVAGKDCTDDEVWIERVGDVVMILTGQAAEDRRNGRAVDAPSFTASSAAPRSAQRDGSWTNLTPELGANPIGLGPSPRLSDEEKAKAFQQNPLEQIERSIIETGGVPSN